MLHWRKRISEWRTVLAQKGVKVSIFALARAVLSGPVPPDVWRDRMRVCLRCPVYNRELKRCGRLVVDGNYHRQLGCLCYTPFLALTAAPYSPDGGCWAREVTKEAKPPSAREGWGAYAFPSWWAKWRAIWRFITCRS
jgi:hypothetical protein